MMELTRVEIIKQNPNSKKKNINLNCQQKLGSIKPSKLIDLKKILIKWGVLRGLKYKKKYKSKTTSDININFQPESSSISGTKPIDFKTSELEVNPPFIQGA